MTSNNGPVKYSVRGNSAPSIMGRSGEVGERMGRRRRGCRERTGNREEVMMQEIREEWMIMELGKGKMKEGRMG